jgi:hypothetical protein
VSIMCDNSVPSSRRAQFVSIMKTGQLILFVQWKRGKARFTFILNFFESSDEFKIYEHKQPKRQTRTLCGQFLISCMLNCKWCVSHQTIPKVGNVGEDGFYVRKYLSIFVYLGLYTRNLENTENLPRVLGTPDSWGDHGFETRTGHRLT